MSLNLFLPAMPDMAADFNVSQATISLTLSGYLVVTGGLQLLIGPLSDALGRRPIVLGSLTVYAIASLGAAYATTIELFLLARFIQGTAIAGNVLSQAIIRDTSVDQRQAATRIALVAMVMAVGPMIAPVVGGALSDLFGWRSNFYFLAASASALLLWCWFDCHETNQHKQADIRGQWQAYQTMLGSKAFWAYASNVALTVAMFYSFLVAIPLVGEAEFGWSKTQIGVALAALPLGYFLGNSITSSITQHVGIWPMIFWGRILAVASPSLCMLLALFEGLSPWIVLSPLIITGIANGLAIPTSQSGAISVNPAMAGTAAGLMGSMVQLLGALSATLTGIVMQGMAHSQIMLWCMLAVAIIGFVPTAIIGRLQPST